jgi:hypothetical protein
LCSKKILKVKNGGTMVQFWKKIIESMVYDKFFVPLMYQVYQADGTILKKSIKSTLFVSGCKLPSGNFCE